MLAIGLLACLYVGVRRERHEHRANRVEIVMDDADFASLARSYAYDQRAFLIALRRAGLTSLAVQEELGGQIAASSNAAVYSGTALLAQSKLFGFRDPVFARLAAHGVRNDEVYLIAYDAADCAALRAPARAQVRAAIGARAARAESRRSSRSARKRTTSRRSDSGFRPSASTLARELGLHLVPRLQNDERFRGPQIDALVRDAALRHDAHTVDLLRLAQCGAGLSR